jgi:prevent-host-death family protein
MEEAPLPRYSIAEAGKRLPKLVEEALAGEKVTITRNGEPVVVLKPTAAAIAGQPSPELVNEIAARARRRPKLAEPAVDIIRRMRDEREQTLASDINASAPMFSRYVGVDYSGAETPLARLPGIRVYITDGIAQPSEVLPLAPARRWSRRALAEWLIAELATSTPALVGIDHAFSFPLHYFDKYRLERSWPLFLDDFQRHWPTDEDNVYVDFVREGMLGHGAARRGSSKWRRLAEERARGAKSVFHFDAPGSVAKSTHAGLPWLRAMRQRLGVKVRFWPFEGWSVPSGRSTVVEVYPALHKHGVPLEGRNPHQQDAYCVALWMAQMDRRGRLGAFFHPNLTALERDLAAVEGWFLGLR